MLEYLLCEWMKSVVHKPLNDRKSDQKHFYSKKKHFLLIKTAILFFNLWHKVRVMSSQYDVCHFCA